MADGEVAYDTLAGVYEWLVPEALLTPEGAADAFAGVVQSLPAGGRVLDCASGPGQLAVGLAKRGFEVTASDASPAMVERTERLAAEHRVELRAFACPWEDLEPGGFGGPLVLTSRNWELIRRRAGGLEVADELVERHGQPGLVVYNWTLAAQWDDAHFLDVAVARLGPDGLTLESSTYTDDDERHLVTAILAG